MKLEAVFFDLDGTLIDSAPDFDVALNQQLKLHGMDEIEAEKIRPWVSHGSPALMKLAFNLLPKDDGYEDMRQEFLDIYEKNLGEATEIFDGVNEVLEYIDADKNLVWGIVTNKPYYLAKPLIKKLGWENRCSYLLGGDSLKERKPHPLPLLHISRQCNVLPQNAIYIGDALRDIASANAAGMTSVAALYGYYTDQENPQDWNADHYIDKPIELISLVESLMQKSSMV